MSIKQQLITRAAKAVDLTPAEHAALMQASKPCTDCPDLYTCDNSAGYLDCPQLAARLVAAGIPAADVPDLLRRYNG